jgi:hypothetical protein
MTAFGRQSGQLLDESPVLFEFLRFGLVRLRPACDCPALSIERAFSAGTGVFVARAGSPR